MTDIARRISELTPEQRALLQRRVVADRKEATASLAIPRRGDVRIPTSGEERLWFLDQMDGASALYNISIALDLTGALHVDAVARALAAIVRRHETLRTHYTSDGGALRIVVDDDVALAFRVEDLRTGVNGSEPFGDYRRSQALEDMLSVEAAKSFALDRDPMLRAILYRVTDNDSTLQITVHHIASDGWSMDILRREFADCYNAAVSGREPRLPVLPVRFCDYASWMNDAAQRSALEKSAEHWGKVLRGSSTVLEIPTDRARPKVRSVAGRLRKYEFATDSVRALHEFARAENATPFMVLLAALFTVMHRYSGQSRIIIGTPMAARTRSDVEGMIGFFANTVPIPADLLADPTFRELLQQVRGVALDAYAHQDVPFEKLVQVLNPERDPGRPPLIQAMLSLEKDEIEEMRLDGLKTSSRNVHSGTSKFDFTVHVGLSHDVATASIEYNSEIFEPETVDRLYSHLYNCLHNAMAHPDDRVSAISLIGESERDTLLRTWNATALDYPKTIPLAELIEEQVERTPDAVAVVFGDTVVTYRELNDRANQLARELISRGAEPGSLIGLYVERSAEMMIALLAIIKAGAGYVPLEPTYPRQRIEYMIADSGIDILVTEASLRASVGDFAGVIVEADGADWSEHGCTNLGIAVSEEEVAYVIYTSGSTGKPKGARILRRGLTNIIWTMRSRMGLSAADRWLAITTISFDFSVTEIWLPWLLGAPIIVANSEERTDVDRLRALMEKHDITVMQATPTTWATLFTAGWRGKRNLKCMCGGEKLSQGLAASLVDSVEAVWNIYGPTETTVWCTTFHVVDAEQTVLIGRPAANTRCYILDPNRQLQPIGVTGELYVAGDGVAGGYQNRPELTRERFIKNPFDGDGSDRMYKTGDLARYRPDGNIEWLGRADDQVKIRGFRIELGEIEEALRRHERVRQAFVAVREDVPGDRRLVAYIAADGASLAVAEVRRHLKQTLPDYMVPVAYVMLESLPMMANGKVDRQALPEPEYEPIPRAGARAVPRTAVEEMVAVAWREVLKTGEFGIDDDFFELGGHSLTATQVITRLRAATGIQLPIRLLFEHRSIAALAKAIERLDDASRVISQPFSQPLSQHAARQAVASSTRDDQAPFRTAPLSFVQEQMWLVDQLQPRNTAYVIGCTVQFSGQLDVGALRDALTEIVRRHEILRTAFVIGDGAPVQAVQSAAPVAVESTDLTAIPEADRDGASKQVELDEMESPFDLAAGAPIRFRLIALHPDLHKLVVSAHHIVLDGWSLQVFVRELGALYAASAHGAAAKLPALEWQYADFAAWQREQSKDGALEPLIEYWREQLAGAPPVLGLPLDHPRRPARSFDGAALSARVHPELAESLAALARSEGATLFMALLAAFQLLLSRLSGEDDVVLGVPIAGRTRVETEAMLGCFLNTIPIRTKLDGNPSFRELLRRARQSALGAYAHQEIPFDLLVERLRPQRSLSYAPLFQVLFNMLNIPALTEDLPGMRVERRDGAEAKAKFDLTMYLDQRSDGIRLRFVYSTDIFSTARAAAMLRQYETLLGEIVAAPDARIADYSLVAPDHTSVLPDPSAPLSASWEGSVPEVFAARVAAVPEAAAVVSGETTWTYRELDERSNQLAHRLRTLGAGRGEVVAIYAERSASLVWALMGILKAGAAFVVLDRAYPAARLADYVRAARPCAVVALAGAGSIPSELSQCIDEVGGTICPLPHFTSPDSDADLRAAPMTPPDTRIVADDTAYIAFTSGTTGKPKGIIGRHGSLTHFTPWIASEFRIGAGDRFSMLSGLAHDPLHRDVFTPLQLGACVCVPAPDVVYDPSRLRDWMRNDRVTVAHLTPAMGQLLTGSLAAEPLDDLRLAFFVGDALTRRDVARLHAIAPRIEIINYYGTTETQRAVSYFVATRDESDAISPEVVPLGRGIPDVQLLVLTQTGRLAGIGEVGEVFVRSPHIAKGYLEDEALTADRFVANPLTHDESGRCYRSGDLGRYDPEGNVVAVGRADAQVKVRGFRVELAEIEAVLGRHPSVRDCVVATYPDAMGETQLAAYVVAEGPAPTADELRAMLRERLPMYMVVTSVTFLDALPLTPNGKVDRRALPAPSTESAGVRELRPSHGPVQYELVALWKEMLNVPAVGITDDFFELGGHSLLAAAMMERVSAIFGRRPALSVLFEEPTIRHLARSLVEDAGFAEARAVCIQRGEPDRVPLFLFHGDYFGGGLYCRKLLRHLDPGMPVYVIAPHTPGGPETIHAMAADVLPHIREIQPHSPYVLAGYCNGGVVAVEVAAQLRRSGDAVDFLAVIDVGARNVQLASLYALINRVTRLLGFDERRQLDTFMLLREPALRFLDKELPRIDESSGYGTRAVFGAALISLLVRRSIRRAWRAVLRAAGLRPADALERRIPLDQLSAEDHRRLARSQYISRAMFSYIPRPYDGTITVIAASEGRKDASIDQLRHWRSIAKRVDAFVIPGTHTSIVTSDIAGLGELLRAEIARVA